MENRSPNGYPRLHRHGLGNKRPRRTARTVRTTLSDDDLQSPDFAEQLLRLQMLLPPSNTLKLLQEESRQYQQVTPTNQVLNMS